MTENEQSISLRPCGSTTRQAMPSTVDDSCSPSGLEQFNGATGDCRCRPGELDRAKVMIIASGCRIPIEDMSIGRQN